MDLCRLKEQYDDNTLLEELQKRINELDVNIVNLANNLQIGRVLDGHAA